MGLFGGIPAVKKGDMLYAWTNDEEIKKKAELGGAVTALWKHALESKAVDAVFAVKKGSDVYDARPVLITDPKELARDCRFPPLRNPSPAKTGKEIPGRSKNQKDWGYRQRLRCNGFP